jgi:hypothetical protein
MKKDPIDSLFEEKLKDYGELPGEKVWKSIEHSLDQKKNSRRILPIWWKLGGAAAVLAALLYLLGPGLPVTETMEDPVTNTDDTRSASPEIDSGPGQEFIAPKPPLENEVSSAADKPETKPANDLQSQKNPRRTNTELPVNENQIADKENANDRAPGRTNRDRLAGAQQNDSPAQPSENDPDNVLTAEAQLAHNRTQENTSDRQTDPADTEAKRVQNSALKQPGEEQIAVAGDKDESSEGKSIYDAIAESEEEKVVDVANNGPKWSVGPKVAPVYFNSFGEGSPIHSNFAANSKSGNVNLSYGLSISYDLTPKLSIRSGIHKVDYGYDTNDITFSPTLAATSGQQLTTINYTLSSRNLVVRNTSQAKLAQDVLEAEVSAEFAFLDGRMVQQFGYVEVPLELNLSLVDRKLGLNLIGGLSSLFLIDNSVRLESNGNAMEMGEANNLNAMNFSTNIGIGVEYEVTPRLQLNLEPVFKYQLNTFSASAGTFNPYSIGVYSGINFRF